MSEWRDPEVWKRLVTADGCPICRRGAPTNVIAELETSWVVMGDGPSPLPGTCALFLKRHAIELHDLAPDEAAAFMRDAQRLSRALKSVTGAVKMNYEVHGNTIPHLHMHFFPRYVGDPFEGQPINPRIPVDRHSTPAERDALRRRLLDALGYTVDRT